MERSEQMEQNNPRCVWDLTIWKRHNEDEVEKLKRVMKEWCKKWCFQAEQSSEEARKGSTEGWHYQARISLKVKVRKSQVEKMFPDSRVSPTSTANMANMFYVMKKDDSYRAGPWKDDDIELPRDVKEMLCRQLYPWQSKIVDWCDTYHMREILVVVDKKGGVGKSSICRLLYATNPEKVGLVPPINNTKDLMQAVCSMGIKSIYIFDMPRAMEKKYLAPIYAAIEQVKGGWAYDTRYTYKSIMMDPPNVIVFTNDEPNKELLSGDRWEIMNLAASALVDEVCHVKPFDPHGLN